MNSIPASVFILCIVKLQEFCYKYGFNDYSALADILIDASTIEGNEISKNFPLLVIRIRNSEPFTFLDLDQETFVYTTFKRLKLGL